MAVLVGKQAPEFKAKAVQKDKIIENFSLKSLRGKYVLFFFYLLILKRALNVLLST